MSNTSGQLLHRRKWELRNRSAVPFCTSRAGASLLVLILVALVTMAFFSQNPQSVTFAEEFATPVSTPLLPGPTSVGITTGILLAASAEFWFETSNRQIHISAHFQVSEANIILIQLRLVCADDRQEELFANGVFPLTVDIGTSNFDWSFKSPPEECIGGSKHVMLARFAESDGEPEANALAASGTSGWSIVQLDTKNVSSSGTVVSTIDELMTETPVAEELEPTVIPDPPATVAIQPNATSKPDSKPVSHVKFDPASPTSSKAVISEQDASSAAHVPGGQERDVVVVVAQTQSVNVLPAHSLSLVYKVTNATNDDVTVQLTTTDTTLGWTSEINWDGIDRVGNGEVVIFPGASLFITVIVTPPASSLVGETNSTVVLAV